MGNDQSSAPKDGDGVSTSQQVRVLQKFHYFSWSKKYSNFNS